MSPEETDVHIKDLFEGVIDAEGHAALAGELRENPEARTLYQEHFYIHLGLQMRGQIFRLRSFADIVPMEKLAAQQRRYAFRIAMAAAAVIFFATVIVFKFIILPEPPLARFTTSLATQYTLIHAEGADAGAGENELLEGSRLIVRRGTVELDLLSGVRSIVGGPAELVLATGGHLDLQHGTAWFEVPAEAVGFQVDTPELLITDLGTSFGVYSKPDVRDEIHVFAGTVEVAAHSAGADALTLYAGNARRVLLDGSLEQIPLDTDPFLTELPKLPPSPARILDVPEDVTNGIPGVAYNGATGSVVLTSGWSQTALSNLGYDSSREHYSPANSAAGATAVWTFTGLAPGSYRVHVFYFAGENRTPSAPYEIFDGTVGGALLASPTIDQESAPNDLTVDDGQRVRTWELLSSSATITGTTLSVRLTSVDNISGATNFVMADAIRIEQIP